MFLHFVCYSELIISFSFISYKYENSDHILPLPILSPMLSNKKEKKKTRGCGLLVLESALLMNSTIIIIGVSSTVGFIACNTM